MSFESLLASFETTDREALSAMAAKYPSLRNLAERGELLSTLEPRLKKLSGQTPKEDYFSDPALAVEELENWREWKANKWPGIEQANQELRDSLAAAQAKIVEFENNQETEMTPEEIDARVDAKLKALGVVTTADVDTKLETFGKERVLPSMNDWGGRIRTIYGKLTPKLQEYKDTFNEILDPEKIFSYMDENKLLDPVKAYEAMTAPKFAEREKAKHEEENKKAREEGIAEGRRAASQSLSGRGIPVDGKSSVVPGPLVQRHREKMAKLEAEGKAGSSKLGSGVAAATAAREYTEKVAAGSAA